jgi:hypothetical protein
VVGEWTIGEYQTGLKPAFITFAALFLLRDLTFSNQRCASIRCVPRPTCGPHAETNAAWRSPGKRLLGLEVMEADLVKGTPTCAAPSSLNSPYNTPY